MEQPFDTNGFVTFNYILASIKNDLGYGKNDRDDETIKQWLIDAYSEINMESSIFSVVNRWLEIDSNLQLNFPVDMIDYEMLSIPVNGRMWSYTRDNRIIETRSNESCGVVTSNSEEGLEKGTDDSWHYGTNGAINSNYFKPDYKLRRFTFDNINRTSVLLTYRTTGVSMSATTYIPRRAVKALKNYVKWMLEERKPDAAYNSRILTQTRWEGAKHELEVSQRGMMRLDEIADAMYGTYQQTIKR